MQSSGFWRLWQFVCQTARLHMLMVLYRSDKHSLTSVALDTRFAVIVLLSSTFGKGGPPYFPLYLSADVNI
jgi:hypothetical protein